MGRSEGEVVKVRHDDKSVELTCTATNGKPAAEITWHRNDEAITEGVVYTTEDVADSKLQVKA